MASNHIKVFTYIRGLNGLCYTYVWVTGFSFFIFFFSSCFISLRAFFVCGWEVILYSVLLGNIIFWSFSFCFFISLCYDMLVSAVSDAHGWIAFFSLLSKGAVLLFCGVGWFLFHGARLI